MRPATRSATSWPIPPPSSTTTSTGRAASTRTASPTTAPTACPTTAASSTGTQVWPPRDTTLAPPARSRSRSCCTPRPSRDRRWRLASCRRTIPRLRPTWPPPSWPPSCRPICASTRPTLASAAFCPGSPPTSGTLRRPGTG
ncbi:hypothetical protein VTK73DRAFT_5828 [Phialemonium thermophilum]|uniref:Uncharacterized protein n=1 Tax=Phialemonium thermophilum TaxID=223376 RepID=A0ABR3V0G0_9PEZI